MRTSSSAASPQQTRSVARARAISIVLALAAIPLLMVTLDPIVGRATVPIMGTTAVERLLSVANPLGNWRPMVALGFVFLIAAAVRGSRDWARLGVALILTMILCSSAQGMKSVVRRPRPWAAADGLSWQTTLRDWKWGMNGQAQSFPSGDVTCAAGLALFGFLAVRRGRARYLFFLIPLISTAGRVLGGKHYPSDCLAGLLLGLAMAALAWRLWPEPRAKAPPP